MNAIVDQQREAIAQANQAAAKANLRHGPMERRTDQVSSFYWSVNSQNGFCEDRRKGVSTRRSLVSKLERDMLLEN